MILNTESEKHCAIVYGHFLRTEVFISIYVNV